MRRKRVPMWFKLLYSAMCAILIPIYLRDYGPTNFLYFCDVALVTTLIALWMESALLASASAIAILLPQFLWVIDFTLAAFSLPATGTTAYMFSPTIPLFTRGLSFYHAWLPFAVVFLVWRLGYDKRALRPCMLTAWVLLLISYFLMPAPPAPASNPNLPVNINFAYGIGDAEPQHWMPPLAWFALVCVVFSIGVFYPTHLFLSRFAPQSAAQPVSSVALSEVNAAEPEIS